MYATLIELLRWRSLHQPDREGFRSLINGEQEGPSLTYGELDRQARAIGALLQSHKAYGERVLLLYPPGLEFIAAFFGCLYAGAIAVPAYPPRRNRQLSRIPAIVKDSQAAFALTTAKLRSKIESWFAQESGQLPLHVLTTDCLEEGVKQQWREPMIKSHNLAFLQYTSGSTAIPKGVMVSHGNLLHNLAMIYKCFKHTPESQFVSWLPLYHDMGLIGAILQPLFGGFPVVFMSPAAFIQRPVCWLQAISKYRATTSGGPNFGYELCVDKITPEQREMLDLNSWEIAFNGAEPIHHETIENFTKVFEPCGFRKEAFYPCYGLAEATLFVTGPRKAAPPLIKTFKESALEKNLLIETSIDDPDSRTFVGGGQTLTDQMVIIVDPETLTVLGTLGAQVSCLHIPLLGAQTSRLPEFPEMEEQMQARCLRFQEVGEIWIAGPSVTQGYWNQPKETEETFRATLSGSSPLMGRVRGGRTRQPEILVQPKTLSPLPNLPHQGGGTFLRTGDLGFIKDGELFITGRLKDLIIIRGRNHYPEDIEWRIEHCHSLIKNECSAVFTVDITGEERLVVVAEVEHRQWDRRRKSRQKPYQGVERRRSEQLQSAIPRIQYVEKAIAKIRQVVTEHHELQVYAILLLKPGTIPKTSSGKTQRHACKTRYLEKTLNILASSILGVAETASKEQSLDREALLAQPPAEQRKHLESYLKNLIATVLHVEQAQIHRKQRLSTLGIDSLMAVELQHRIKSEVGIDWPITMFLCSTNIAELSEEGLHQLHDAPVAMNPGIVVTHFSGKFPLSHNQQALWFLYRLDPSSAAYNVPFALRIRSTIDLFALQRAFQRLIDRHDVLRTTYDEYHGELRQHVHEHLPVPFEEIDVSTWDWEAILAKLTEFVHRPFDLEQGPVLRITLMTRAADDHILLLTFHHVAVDFWSLLVMMDELGVLYLAEKNGTLTNLPLHTLSYGDFIHWQAEMLQGPEGERLFAYWRERLGEELPVPNLPTDRPRPPVQTYHGASYAFTLDRELTRRLHTIARLGDATVYMTLLAAFQVLLSRYTGQEDILVGSPAAGRTMPGFDETVGYFVNPVVLRADLSGNPPFFLFLKQVRQRVLEALEHQDYPFPLLVERLNLQRDASRSPVFQVMFVMQEPHRLEAAAPFALREAGASMNLGGLKIESMPIAQRSAQFDLTLMMVEAEDRLAASLEYNTDLFDAATIQRMAGHFQTLLEGIVARPEQRVGELPLLTAAERHQILVAWNDTKTDYPKDKWIHELFEEQVERTPNATAIVFPDSPNTQSSIINPFDKAQDRHQSSIQLTYRELNARANQLAHYLRKLGVGPEVLVGICVERSLEMVIGLLGILKAGGAYVPLDPDYPKERLAFMLEDTEASVLLTHKRLIGNLPECYGRTVYLDTDWGDVIAKENIENLGTRVTPENLAYVIYTSGSTGKPKGVLISHDSIANHCCNIQHHYELNSTDRVLQFASCNFDTSLEQILPALITGAMVVMRGNAVWAAAEFHEKISDFGVTVVNLPPAYWQQITQEWLKVPERFPNNQLRLVIVGGDVMLPEALNLWQQLPAHSTRLLNAYGPTEATITATTFEIELCPHNSTPSGNIPIGHPLSNKLIYILDAYGSPVPIGVPGELHIGGNGLARGYLNHPELTEEKFIPNPFSAEPGARLYKTGDLARYLPDGNIEFLGRIDHQVKIRGFRVELGEIETVLTEHPDVQETVVIVREDQPGNKRLIAYIVGVKGGGQKVKGIGLREYLKKRLPDYMIPVAFIALDALPLTPNGKINRRALPAPDAFQGGQDEGHAIPRNHVEEILADIWADVLKLERVGIHDNFFEIGGDSIISIRIIARAKQAGLQTSLVDILRYQTIAELSTVVQTTSVSQTEQGSVTGSVPLIPIQRWFFEQNFTEPHHWNQAILFELRQPPDVALLRKALRQTIDHHDTLRLRFRRTEAGWRQEYSEGNVDDPFVQISLSQVFEREQEQAMAAEAAKLQASLDLAEGPLIRAALFDAGVGKPHRLLIVIHHLVVDSVSWRILLEDLEALYLNNLAKVSKPLQSFGLPPKTASFKQWAEHLRNYAQSKTIAAELEYWLSISHSSGVSNLDLTAKSPISPAAKLKFDTPEEVNTVASADQVSILLSPNQTRMLLQEVPKAYHTQMNDMLLTALLQAFSHWTGERSLLIDLEGHGRDTGTDHIDVSRTLGWFTSIFPVVLTLESDHPGEVLKSVKEQLRRIPKQGIGYGLLRYLGQDETTRRKLRKLPEAALVFNYLGQLDQMVSESTLFKPLLSISDRRIGLLRSLRGHRSHVLEINSFVADERLHAVWTYSRNIHERKTIEYLAQEFIQALQALIDHCLSPDAGGYTPSDFAAARLNQQQLDKIMDKLKNRKR